jgi:preprotein translocase subunit Sec61beta
MDIVAFFNNLHWTIRLPAKLIAAVCGAYVSNHPDIFPSWAVVVGAVIALWVVIAFLWQLLNAWREHTGKQRLRLDPQIILIACLVVALGAAVWQWWRGDPQVAGLQSQITVLKAQLLPSTPIAPVPAASPSPEEIERVAAPLRSQLAAARDQLATAQRELNEARALPPRSAERPAVEQPRPLTNKEEEVLRDLSEIINNKGRAASNLAESLLQFTHPLSGNTTDQEPSVLRERAQEIANVVDALDIEIYRSFLPARTFYSKELLAALGTSSTNRVDGAMYPFSQTALGYVGSLNRAMSIADQAKNEQVSRMVISTTTDNRNNFETASKKFAKWIDDFNSRVEERRRVK